LNKLNLIHKKILKNSYTKVLERKPLTSTIVCVWF